MKLRSSTDTSQFFLDRLDINTSTNLKQKIYGKNGKTQFALHIQI